MKSVLLLGKVSSQEGIIAIFVLFYVHKNTDFDAQSAYTYDSVQIQSQNASFGIIVKLINVNELDLNRKSCCRQSKISADN